MDDQREQRDETIERMRAVLTPLPSVAPSSIARVLAATAHRRPPSAWARFGEWIGTPSLSLARAGALAAATLVIGFVARGAMRPDANAPSVTQAPTAAAGGASTAAATAPSLQAANANGARVAVQLVFDAPDARSVSVVGDFNDWQPTATPMRRLEAGQPWSALVLIPPGRHAYALLVDGTRWVADPRAPRARDDDFGKPQSVLFVQTP